MIGLRSWKKKKSVGTLWGPHRIIVNPSPRTLLSDTSVFCRLPEVFNIDWWGKGKCKTKLWVSSFTSSSIHCIQTTYKKVTEDLG